MKTKKIYIIRHGETDYNFNGIIQGGGIDSSLNKKGIRQAKAFYRAYKKKSFGVVYTSTLKRTTESVQLFIENGLAQIKLSGLNEMNWGVCEGLKINNGGEKKIQNIIDRWSSGETSLAVEQGESPEDVVKRLLEVIEIIKLSKESIILICMHGRALRIFLTQLLTIPLKEMDQFFHENLCLYQVNYTNGLFSLQQENNINHLKKL